jgi:hypothetical protein
VLLGSTVFPVRVPVANKILLATVKPVIVSMPTKVVEAPVLVFVAEAWTNELSDLVLLSALLFWGLAAGLDAGTALALESG